MLCDACNPSNERYKVYSYEGTHTHTALVQVHMDIHVAKQELLVGRIPVHEINGAIVTM